MHAPYNSFPPGEARLSALPSVLVIDGEVRSVEALEGILEDDFDVKKATSIEEAEVILAEEAIQVVLCDQRMPGMSGVEFLKAVRERWPDVVRMIISDYTDAEDIIYGFRALIFPALISSLRDICRSLYWRSTAHSSQRASYRGHPAGHMSQAGALR